jgi:hypothetical protein
VRHGFLSGFIALGDEFLNGPDELLFAHAPPSRSLRRGPPRGDQWCVAAPSRLCWYCWRARSRPSVRLPSATAPVRIICKTTGCGKVTNTILSNAL